MTTASGTHQPTTYLHVLWAIERSSKSGHLQIESGTFRKEIYFLDGHPVFYRSNLPDDELEKSLQRSNLVPAAQLSWFLSRLDSQDSLEAELVSAGLLKQSQVDTHKLDCMQYGIGHALTWRNSTWQFTAHPWLDGRISSSLQPALSRPRALWDGVQLIPNNDIYTVIGGLMKHTFKGDHNVIEPFIRDLGLSELEWLSEALSEGCLLNTISQKGGDPINAFRLVWLLYNLGLLNNPSPPEEVFSLIDSADPLSRERELASYEEPSEQVEAEPTEGRRRSRRSRRSKATDNVPLSEVISQEYAKRLGKDYYGFLGAKQKMTYKRIDTICKQLLRKWKGWLNDPSLKAQKEQVQELMIGAKLVHRTLTDPIKRAEYDNLLESGTAPLVDNPRAALSKQKRQAKDRTKTKSTSSRQEDPIAMMFKQNDYERALPLLQKARQQSPSDPNILARLGWAIWRVKHDYKSAEDYLKLAMTFDSKNIQAIEWYAQILVQRKEKEQALRLVQLLLKLSPGHTWAQNVLPSLQPGDDKSNKGWFQRK